MLLLIMFTYFKIKFLNKELKKLITTTKKIYHKFTNQIFHLIGTRDISN